MGGRGSSSASAQTRASISSMGTMSSAAGSGGNIQNSQVAKQSTVATNQQMNAANNANFSDTDNAPFHELYGGRQYFLDQTLSIAAQTAIMEYIDPNTVPGTRYSPSQILNTALALGLKLDPQQDYVARGLKSAMHNLGYNLTLTRYDHADFANQILKNVGVSKNMNNASVADLKKMIGHQFTEKRFVTTSYNDFKKAPSGNPFTDRQVRIVYEAKANTQALMPGKVGRNDWGEIILSPGTNFTVKDVREVSKTGGRIAGTQSHSGRIIEIVVGAEQ